MSKVWNKVITCSDAIIERLSRDSVESTGMHDNRFPWKDNVYSSHKFRRAHVNVVDARESHKLLMLHSTVFPQTNDPSPIFGFDIIAGPSRISGAFHDFSSAGDKDHFMMRWFDQKVTDLKWKKERSLPDWAQAIFSPAMVAIGAVDNLEEIDQLTSVALENLDYYLENVGITQQDVASYEMAQNRYCYYQKQNPHNPRVLQSLGLSESDAKSFVKEIMFPEINGTGRLL